MTGTGILTRFIIKRDKIYIPLWMAGAVALSVMVAPALGEMYTTDLQRTVMAETMQNPAMIAMCGPIFDADSYTGGAMYAQMMLVWCMALWAVMNIFLVVRHTRKDEEEGRLELIKALPTGRQAGIFSTIYVVIGINILVSLLLGFGIAAFGIEDMELHGSLIYGACNGVVGMVFAGIALIFSQVCASSRGALGFSLAALGGFYMMRAVGDIGNEPLSYISPLGLATRTEAYVSNIWWPVLVLVTLALILYAIALKLNSVRDLERGLLSAKKGRSRGSFLLGSTVGLSLRLLRGTLIAWAVTVYILGASYGSIFADIEKFINSNETIKQVFIQNPEADMTIQFVGTLMVIMSIISTIAVLMVILKLRGEEKRGRINDLLAKNVSRGELLSGYVIIAGVFTVVLQILTVMGLWQASTAVMEEPMELGSVMQSGLVYIPAMLVFAGLGAALTGILPRLTILAWLYLGFSFFADYMGPLIDLPEWAGKVTPFGLTPRIPAEDFEAVPVISMCVVSAVLLVIGFVGFRRRDIMEG